MPLPKHIAQIAVDLTEHSEDFRELWKYYKQQADRMVDEILMSETDPVAREILVRVHEIFRQEVVDLPQIAMKQLKPTEPGS